MEGLSKISLKEVVVEFFGCLIPGFIFVVSVVLMYVWPVAALIHLAAILGNRLWSLEEAGRFMGSATSLIAVFIVVVSYVVGFVFYRRDPKLPDKCSFDSLVNEDKIFEDNVRPRWVEDRNGACDYPYTHLRRYLIERGEHHLAAMIPWDGADEPTDNPEQMRRTKNFINILKIRLAFHHPERSGAVARNEAHVRLMSSTWYMSKALMWMSLGAAVMTIATVLLACYGLQPDPRKSIIDYGLPLLSPVAVFLAVRSLKENVQQFFHYQRVREVNFVLETAYTAFRDTPEILRDICPRFGLAQVVPTQSESAVSEHRMSLSVPSAEASPEVGAGLANGS